LLLLFVFIDAIIDIIDVIADFSVVIDIIDAIFDMVDVIDVPLSLMLIFMILLIGTCYYMIYSPSPHNLKLPMKRLIW
jgi:hypothetical protein